MLDLKTYIPDDFDRFVGMCWEALETEEVNRNLVMDELKIKLRRPGFQPEKDLILAEEDGSLCGWISIFVESKINRVIFNVFVHPKYRDKGVGNALVKRAVERADVQAVRFIHVPVHQGYKEDRVFLSRLGFKPVRSFLNMQICFEEGPDELQANKDFEISRLLPEEEKSLVDIQNRCFMGSWGFCPNTGEDILFYFELLDARWDDVLLLKEKGRTCGYCWTHLVRNVERAGAPRRGRIHMMGVIPEERGKGMGKSILTAGLAHLKSRGASIVELSVDGGNHAAVNLYRGFGFSVCSTTDWYQK